MSEEAAVEIAASAIDELAEHILDGYGDPFAGVDVGRVVEQVLESNVVPLPLGAVAHSYSVTLPDGTVGVLFALSSQAGSGVVASDHAPRLAELRGFATEQSKVVYSVLRHVVEEVEALIPAFTRLHGQTTA